MVVVKLMGGLGNQMFQYAFAKKLALKNNTSLKIDLSFLLDRSPRENFVFRDYDLDIFNLEVDFINAEELMNFKSKKERSFIDYLLLKASKPQTVFLDEKNFHFEKANVIDEENAYLSGYWQTEKYFSDIESQIRKDFEFKYSLSAFENELNNQINGTNSVCVNFRRTDFVDVKGSAETHGLTEMSYYKRAVELISKQIDNPHFYIFSDDIEWCKDNVKIDFPITFVDHSYKGHKFSTYLQLMKNCKHFIIPNSTFAWWAAWLCQNDQKLVIAPKRWFKDQALQNQTEDILPEKWFKL
jgi:hypothetical protein